MTFPPEGETEFHNREMKQGPFFINDDFSEGPDSPILLYPGNEDQIETFITASGALYYYAESLKATVVFIEHRFYGKSFGAEILAFEVVKTAGENIPVLHGSFLADGFGERWAGLGDLAH